MSVHDPYILRVKYGGELDTALRVLEDGPQSEKTIKDTTGMARSAWLLRNLDKWFDNVSVGMPWGDETRTHELHYTDVMPHKVQVVTSDVKFNVASEGISNQPQEMSMPLVWPLAPPIIDVSESFDEPEWFRKMEAMIQAGRHISLEGPPGVGKDTAVEQLAAKHRKPLVTIGGDSGFRRRDLTGSPQIANGTSYFNVAEYVAAAVNGWWVLLSEVNAADPDALMYINTQLAPPHIVTLEGKAYPVHKDFRIFVTYNHGLVGTKPLPSSFKDRFFSVKIPFFSKGQLRKRLEAMGMPADGSNPNLTYNWTNKVVEYGVQMWDAHTRGQMRYQITTRRLIDAVELYNCFRDDAGGYNISNALRESVISAIDSPVEQKAAEAVLTSVMGH